MVTEFIAKNWKLIAAIAGLGIVREVVQRWKSIDLQGKVVLITGGSRGLGWLWPRSLLTSVEQAC